LVLSPADRLADFDIGVGYVNPTDHKPVADETYDVCATQDDALGQGETRSYACNKVGKYVIVQLKGKNYLTLCEVSVLGGN
jgi:hypothetical protein